MDLVTLFTAFGILFLGELGDKTQLIVFNLTLEYEKPWKVGVGATLGFGIIVTIGVLLGAIIIDLIPLFLISLIGGIIFVIIGILDARHLKKLWNDNRGINTETLSLNDPENENDVKKKDITSKLSKLKNNPILAGFLFIFLMELGDKTQILTITLASTTPAIIEIWLGSFLALSLLAWMGVFFGEIITKKLPKFYLKVISVSLFVFIGIWLIIASILS